MGTADARRDFLRIKQAGYVDEFNRRVRAYVASGMKTVEARSRANRECLDMVSAGQPAPKPTDPEVYPGPDPDEAEPDPPKPKPATPSGFSPESMDVMTREDIAFCYQYANPDVPAPMPDDAPSAGAYGYLMELRESVQVRGDFYRNIATKFLPTKSEVERQQRLKRSSGELLEMTRRIREARELAEGRVERIKL